jgi:hypothetical protein
VLSFGSAPSPSRGSAPPVNVIVKTVSQRLAFYNRSFAAGNITKVRHRNRFLAGFRGFAATAHELGRGQRRLAVATVSAET